MGAHTDQDGSDRSDLQFDRILWQRFLQLAQPYFYPVEEGGRAWALVLLALLLGVVGGAYWLAALASGLALILGPASLVPAELAGRVEQLWSLPLPLVGFALVAAAGLIVQRHGVHLRQRMRQWLMLASLLFLMFCVSGLNVYISFVFRGIDNKLMEKDAPGFYKALASFSSALVVAVPIIGSYRFMRMTLARHWRAFMCNFFLEGYLAHRTYYKLDSNSENADIDNPDQRLTEDIDYFTSETLTFLLDVLGGILDLFSFVTILWSISKPLMGSLVIYASAGTCVALAAGQRLVTLNYEKLRKEADLRYSLVRVRDNAEAIAFYGGERLEGAAVRERLAAVMHYYDRLVRWTTFITMYQKLFDYLARVVPYMVIGGLYFAGEVDFGTMGQGAFAFDMVLSSVTLIVTNIKEISRFSAGVSRLGAFYDELKKQEPPNGSGKSRPAGKVGKAREEELQDLLEAAHPDGNAGAEIITTTCPNSGLRITEMTLRTPTGRTLVEQLSLAPSSGSLQRLLIVGPSGFGKSSVLRAIAGLWTHGTGHIKRPSNIDMLFLPQKPYMPLGDLRTQLLYPDLLAECADSELEGSLSLLGLGDLPSRFPGGLNAVQDWGRILSVGEQQRLAAARCLVKRPAPALVFLDEATSALPVRDEANLYRLLLERDISYISVGHRESLLEHHDLVLEICGEGKWGLHTSSDYRFGSEPPSTREPPKTPPSHAASASSLRDGVDGEGGSGHLRRRDKTPEDKTFAVPRDAL